MKVTANGVGIRYDLARPPDAPVVTLHCSCVEADQAFNAALLEFLAGMA